jgi:hypothetical protein
MILSGARKPEMKKQAEALRGKEAQGRLGRRKQRSVTQSKGSAKRNYKLHRGHRGGCVEAQHNFSRNILLKCEPFRNVIERLPKPLNASVRRALRQAWELDYADKAERLLRNLARRLDREAPGRSQANT